VQARSEDISAGGATAASAAAPSVSGEARFWQSSIPQASLDPDGVITSVNPALTAFSGYAPEELVGLEATEFLLDEQLAQGVAGWQDMVTGAVASKRVDRLLRRADGQVRHVRLSMYTLHTQAGEIASIEAALEDVTDVVTAQQELRASERRWRSLALRSADVAFLADADGNLLFATPSLTRHFGYSEAEVVGANGFTFFHPDDEARAREAWSQVLSLDGYPVLFRARVRRRDGDWRWIEETATNWLADPDVAAVVANIIDVTDTVLAGQQFATLADVDPLTGLATRAALLRSLRAAPAAAGCALLLVNLNEFRRINNEQGHVAGDDVLLAVADRLRQLVRPDDVVARLNADNFAALVRNVDSAPAVTGLCEQIVTALAEPVTVGRASIPVTVRVGAAQLPVVHGTATNAFAAMQAAEAALDRARPAAPVAIGLADPGEATRLAVTAAVRELHSGLDRGDLVPYYQPIVDLTTGRAFGVEALARWQHPERGLLLPAEFLQLAEDSGLVVKLGATMLRSACAAAAGWRQQQLVPTGFTVSVNLSPRQIAQPDVIELVRGCLTDAGLPPQNLILEVTETAVMDDIDAASATLRQLRGLGVGLALDDFGTGYSSLTYLRRFPLTQLKIDRSFTAGVCNDADDNAIVISVLQLARSIGLDCTAEGVETRDQADLLRSLGCATAQGWLYHKAMSETDLHRWLERQEPAKAPTLPGPVESAEAAASTLGSTRVATRMLTLQSEGASLHTIAAALNAEGYTTADGKRWHARSVARAMTRLESGRSGDLLARAPTQLPSTMRFGAP